MFPFISSQKYLIHLLLVFNYIQQVLTEPKNALSKQYKRLFSMNNVSNLLVHANSFSLTEYLNSKLYLVSDYIISYTTSRSNYILPKKH